MGTGLAAASSSDGSSAGFGRSERTRSAIRSDHDSGPPRRRWRALATRSAAAPSGEAGARSGPTGVDGAAGLIQVEQDRRVIGGHRLALARLPVDLRPDDALGERARHQQVVDAHPVVLVEVTGAV